MLEEPGSASELSLLDTLPRGVEGRKEPARELCMGNVVVFFVYRTKNRTFNGVF